MRRRGAHDHRRADDVGPLLASEVPTLENGGVGLRPDGGMDVTWRLRPGITWHDGTPFTSADVKFTVDAINDPSYNPESTDGFDRITSVETPDPLTAIVHYREVYAPYALQFIRGCLPQARAGGTRHRSRQDYNRRSSAPGPTAWPSGRPANTSCSSACRATGAARRRLRGCSSGSSRTRTRASISSRPARCTWWRPCRGTSTARWRGSRPLDPSDRRQRLRARDAQPAAVLRLRATSACGGR